MSAQIESREQVENPFAPVARTAAAASNAISEAANQREISEIQSAMVIAQKFPRDPRKSLDRVLMACARPTLANAATYNYSRGGSEVTGPSIRLAEALAQSWGNLQFGVRELDQREGESTVEAYAWDLETNTRASKVFQVPHIRFTKNGSYPLTDPRDIYETVANSGSRRLRACILNVIPGDVVDAAVKQCDLTLKATAEVTPERLKSLLDKFGEFNVTRAQIEARIQRGLDSMTPSLLIQLGKIYNSLRDGMSATSDWFGASAAPSGGTEAAKPEAKPLTGAANLNAAQVVTLMKAADKEGVPTAAVCERFKVDCLESLTFPQLAEALSYIKRAASGG